MGLSLPTLNMLWIAVIVLSSWAAWRLLSYLFPQSIDNIRGPEVPSWLKGNRAQLFHPTDGIQFMHSITRDYGGVVRLCGVFGAREMFVTDPLALHSIAVKDAANWQQPAEVLATNSVIFGMGLTSTSGNLHRKQRRLVNPAFSAAHMRHLIPVFYTVSKQLRVAIKAAVSFGPQEIDMLSWTARTALELIGQSGLGYSFDKLAIEEPNDYTAAVKNLLPLSFRIPIARSIAPWLPFPLRQALAQSLPFKQLQDLVKIIKLMEDNSKEVLRRKRDAIEMGEEAIREQIAGGKDLMSILLRANLLETEANRLPEDQLVGLMNGLVFAAMDTTSSALARMLHVLALKPDIQHRLRQEALALYDRLGTDELDYDTLSELPFLDACCRELLRLYAPVPMNLRTAVKDTTLPLAHPVIGKNGQEIYVAHVPAGTTVLSGLLVVNTSTDIWGPDAHEFRPERWLSPPPDSVVNAHLPGIYSNLMTFWGGGSACLGFKFSQLELKVVLSVLLRSFKFSLSGKEITWRQSGLQFPSVEGSTMLSLPLIVEAIEN